MSGPHPGGGEFEREHSPRSLMRKIMRPGHYVVTGLQQHEDYSHKPFDWDGYYVATDLVKKPFDYDDGDYFGDRNYYEDRYRVHYVETE